jgi:hypothetical protein
LRDDRWPWDDLLGNLKAVDFILPYLDETEARLWRMIERAPAPGRHPARNALFNIDRATQIFSVDAEMAVFRCINAEEEAARAMLRIPKGITPGAGG